MSENLKVCPFCGGKPKISPVIDNEIFIMCMNDDCFMAVANAIPEARQDAIKAWNSRVSQNPWVRVGDRLPEKRGVYLITYKYGVDDCPRLIVWYDSGKWVASSGGGMVYDPEKVLAWMEMPPRFEENI